MKVKNSFFLLISVFFFACSDNYTPKPRAFVKLVFPDKQYQQIDMSYNFSFEKPIYSILKDNGENFDLHFPDQNAILHISYFSLQENLLEHIEGSRELAYTHNGMADAIYESVYINHQYGVYGLLYDYDGTTATSTQFYLTDSVNHFFRGALYFNTEISDSLLPINNFLKEDIKHIIESFKWEAAAK